MYVLANTEDLVPIIDQYEELCELHIYHKRNVSLTKEQFMEQLKNYCFTTRINTVMLNMQENGFLDEIRQDYNKLIDKRVA